MRSLLETIMMLKRVPYFEHLRTDQLRHVVPVLEPTGWVAGERVFDLGEASREMYIILRGHIGISLHTDPHRREFITELRDGACFGEMGLLDDQARSATAHVLANTEAYALGKEQLRGLLLSYPELGIGIMQALSRRLREVSAELARARSAHGQTATSAPLTDAMTRK
jgi:CRP-like cAMP-binding protein